MFNRLLTERDDPAHKGQINLKYSGTLPLAEAVRLLALRHGNAATNTPYEDRLIRLQPATRRQHSPGGQSGQGECGCLGPRHSIRHRLEVLLREHEELGSCA
jgi:hypothetical protein